MVSEIYFKGIKVTKSAWEGKFRFIDCHYEQDTYTIDTASHRATIPIITYDGRL